MSVGFSDRSFLVPGFADELVLDDVAHRSQVDLLASHGIDAVTNPHFTFHPPGYVHLRANGHDELFAGLLMIDLMVEHDGRFPWIRFVSNPVETLTPFSDSRVKGTVDIIRLLAPSTRCSIELAVDFVAPGTTPVRPAAGFETYLEWQNRVLHLHAHHQPGENLELPMKNDAPVVHRDPEIMGGTPVFVGTRVPFQTLLDYLEAGDPLTDFLEDFPTVTREQAVAALEQAKQALFARENPA